MSIRGQQQHYWTEAVQVNNTDERPDLSSRHWQNSKCQTVINIWSWAPDGAQHQNGLTDRRSVVTWLGTNVAPPQKDRPFPSSKRRTHSSNTYMSRRKINLGQKFRRDLKPGMTLLARTSSNLTDRPTLQSLWEKMSWALTRKPRTEQYSLEAAVREYSSWAVRGEEQPLLGDCNQATISEGCNKLRRLVWVIVICAALQLLVIPSCKCAINPITNPNPVYRHLTRDSMFNGRSKKILQNSPHSGTAKP
jgi:hypothetical protein